MKSPKRGTKPRTGAIVKQISIKRAVTSILLALVGLAVFTVAYGYTYQSQQHIRLQNTLNQLETERKAAQAKDQTIQQYNQQIQALQKQLSVKRANEVLAEAQAQQAANIEAAGGTVGCGDNQYSHYIYEHESGCRTTTVNSIGCRGIGQACPGSKLPCGDDYVCQNSYFTQYANSRYGGWYNAYCWWCNHGWW